MDEEFVIWGGYGGHNLGDEAILWSMSRLLKKLRPNAAQSVLVRTPVSAQVAKQYELWGVDIVRFGTVSSLRLLTRARLIVGGGQLLDDTFSAWPVGWTSLVLSINAAAGMQPLILCIGAEPIKRKITAFIAKLFYSLARVCSCRDQESLEVVRNLGLPADRLVASRDVVFSLDRALLPKRTRSDNHVTRVTLVLAHDPQRTPGKSDYFSELATEFLEAGCEVSIVAHDLRVEYDYGLLLSLEQEFARHSQVTICNPRLVGESLEIYANSDAVVSGRMHPLILASLVRTLPIAIRGTGKVNSLIGALGLPALERSGGKNVRARSALAALSQKDFYMRLIQERFAEFGTLVESTTADALIG